MYPVTGTAVRFTSICLNRDGETSPSSSGAAVVLDKLSFTSPFSEDLLVKDLSLGVYEGTHLLVVGNTGTGKTSLLRVLNLLWEPSNGERVSKKCLANISHFYIL